MKILFVCFSGVNGIGMAEGIKRAGFFVEHLNTDPFSYFGKGLFIDKVQRRLNWGPGIFALNREIKRSIFDNKPDIVWVFKGTMVKAETIDYFKKKYPSIIWIHENGDDPFGPQRRHYWWKLFLKAIPYYDIHFVYRKPEVFDYMAAGAKKVHKLNFFYLDNLHLPLLNKKVDDFKCDITFVGRWEPERQFALELLAQNGLKVRVWGAFWEKHLKKNNKNLEFVSSQVYGNDYVDAIWQGKIGINILTRLNRDSHGLRSIEVPACGGLLLAERTDEHLEFLREGSEAEFFTSPEEMVDKAVYLSKDSELCIQYGERAHLRVVNDKRDIISKVKLQMKLISEI